MTLAELAGTAWVFRENVLLPMYSSGRNYILGSDSDAPVFESGGVDYYALYYGTGTEGVQYGTSTSASENMTKVYKGGGEWVNDGYRTITFKETLSSITFRTTEAVFINWLTSYAVRQGQKVYKVYEDQIKPIADAIRSKTSSSAGLKFPGGFTDAINGITPKPGTTSVSISGPSSNTTLAPGEKVSLGQIPLEQVLKGIIITNVGSVPDRIFIKIPSDLSPGNHQPAVVYYINTGSSSVTLPANQIGMSYKYYNS